MLKKIDLMGSPNLGVYISVTNEVAIAPMNIQESAEEALKEALDVEIIRTSIAGSNLDGSLSVANSNGIIVSPQTFDREIELLEDFGLNVAKLPNKYTAVGNLVVANDNGAIVSPFLYADAIKIIEDVLDVYVERRSIAGFDIVGSLANVTNKGAFLHANTTEEEIKGIEKILKVPADIGTVGRGTALVGACSIANSYGAIVPENTSGPEMARVEEALGFIDE
jgi:translation initiation factor 6